MAKAPGLTPFAGAVGLRYIVSGLSMAFLVGNRGGAADAAPSPANFCRPPDSGARALVKCDFGDTHANTSVGFADYATRASIKSADKGAMGMELGAGLSVPVGFGCIFADGSVELRPDYTNFNAAAGYRIQF